MIENSIKPSADETRVTLEPKIEPLLGLVAGGEYPTWSAYDADVAVMEALEFLKHLVQPGRSIFASVVRERTLRLI